MNVVKHIMGECDDDEVNHDIARIAAYRKKKKKRSSLALATTHPAPKRSHLVSTQIFLWQR